nr:hypothetical protein [Neisseria gonorrhoeae]
MVVKTAPTVLPAATAISCQVGMPGLLHACLGGVEGNAVDVGQLFGGFFRSG